MRNMRKRPGKERLGTQIGPIYSDLLRELGTHDGSFLTSQSANEPGAVSNFLPWRAVFKRDKRNKGNKSMFTAFLRFSKRNKRSFITL